MKNKNDSKAKANKAKLEKIEARQKAKEAKAAYKLQKSSLKKNKNQNIVNSYDDEGIINKVQIDSKEIKRKTKKSIRVKKIKEAKDKIDWKLSFKEFPVKMVKEVNKIKWSSRINLSKKYITVLIFMAVFALVFYFVDWGLQELFALIKVV
ncbi:preprotein translocase subunit SecE [Williamsoniiplasma somnilux]|uniref:Preprotein translocase subunit SecE n=1 Tax=Williamsoniiplasma somnilux TaxID=215578 RepID=A0A2K8NZ24_9MOLU|nr:preprotein translocase subunit SecE [Williamsoniiplasma somnilux]ATZ19072.1 preprotein translocase subunit SecE [Williamsoniiplasma somnilux]